MIELLIALIMPAIVNRLTQVTKQINPIPQMNGHRILIIRAIVAVFSLLGAIGTVLVGDIGAEELDPGLIETALLTVFNAAIATWLYLRK